MIKPKLLQLRAGAMWARWLTEAFKENNVDVITSDCEQGYDIILPKIDEFEYLDRLKEALKDADFIYPVNHDEVELLVDSELPTISPSLLTLKITNDKYLLSEMLSELGFRSLTVWLEDSDNILTLWKDRIVKDRRGAGASNFVDVDKLHDSNIVIQKKLDKDFQEYTCDLVAYKGDLLTLSVRKRIRASGGVCVEAYVLSKEEILEEKTIYGLVERFCNKFNWNGPCALQLFKNNRGDKFITDVNPRFGGGSEMSHLSGWNGVEIYCNILKYELGILPRLGMIISEASNRDFGGKAFKRYYETVEIFSNRRKNE